MERSDEEIAEITDINLNSVRHTLYNLYEHRLAEYRRIKNNETGWLTYLWLMRMDHMNMVLRNEMEVAAGKLAARLRYDDGSAQRDGGRGRKTCCTGYDEARLLSMQKLRYHDNLQ